jgi:hypothetical protein
MWLRVLWHACWALLLPQVPTGWRDQSTGPEVPCASSLQKEGHGRQADRTTCNIKLSFTAMTAW